MNMVSSRPFKQRGNLMSLLHHSLLDKLIIQADHTLKTLAPGGTRAQRPSPAAGVNEGTLNSTEKRLSAALMRVNHSGEVCAQALYQGQALTAKLPQVREQMREAANEEIDHLRWCEDRLRTLGSHTSLLNPLWYGLSFALGAGAGLLSDRVSLGFVAATEDQVCQHLSHHLVKLPEADTASRVVVTQMLEDEARHAAGALAAGGLRFPTPVKALMTLTSKAMTVGSYYL